MIDPRYEVDRDEDERHLSLVRLTSRDKAQENIRKLRATLRPGADK